MLKYKDSFLLRGHMTLDDAERAIDKVREQGAADRQGDGRRVVFTIEATDLWEMNDILAEVEDELRSLGVDWSPKKDRVTPVLGTLEDLLSLFLPLLPEATVGDDNDGQVVIYTNLRLDGEALVPFAIDPN